MNRRRAFTIAETLTAGASSIIVGGIALAAFLATSTASSMSSSRHYASKEIYRLSVMLRKDAEFAAAIELVSPQHLKLTTKDPTTGVLGLVEYKLTDGTPKRVVRSVDTVTDPLLNTAVDSVVFTKLSDGCLSYQLNFAPTQSEPIVRYKGEVRLRNWIKK